MRNWLGLPVLLGACLLSACATLKPPLPAPVFAREREPVRREFRLAVFNFGRVGVSDGQHYTTLVPAVLLTELKQLGRFSLYEGYAIARESSQDRTAISVAASVAIAQEAGKSAASTEGSSASRVTSDEDRALSADSAHKFVDGYLDGTITSVTGEQVCFDMRLANANNHEVLFARSACVGRAGQPLREGLNRAAQDLGRAIKQVGYGQVTSVDGRQIVCDKGAKAGVLRGMVAYILGSGDTVKKAELHQRVASFSGAKPEGSAPLIVGELYITAVEDDYSIGVLSQGRYAMPGDSIFFK